MPGQAHLRSNAQLPQTFAPGARVVARGEEWIVRRAGRTNYGDTELHVTGMSELVRGRDFVFLTPGLDAVAELKPEETALVADDSPGYRKTRLYLESLLRTSPPTEPRVYLGHRGAMDAAPYQLVPAAKALAQHRPRILIADAVGLGKTVEAGVLLTELIRRGRGRRILVVALKSVLQQLQQELWARFTIPLVRLDSEGLARVQRKLPANANPFHTFDRVIVSIDTLKKDEKYRRYLEQCRWDATLIDECQHVAVRARSVAGRSQRARLAELLAGTCDALVLTSATPHDGRPESFASLMNLLEPTAVADVEHYTREDIQGLYVRRFKKDIAHQTREAFRPRSLRRHTVAASPAENAVYDVLADAQFRTLQARGAGDGVLFRTTLLKGLLSSPEALLQTVEERDRKLAKAPEKPGVPEDRALLEALAATARAAIKAGTSKHDKLLELLRSMGIGPKADERVVIFSERIKTLERLEATLPGALGLPKEAVVCFHGSLDDTTQQALVKEFGTADGRVRVLLCSDAASEGINLHFYCHRLVHYDIPWSLITLEQRNGRIDRFGQQHAPEIHTLLTEPGHERLRGDLRILDVLVQKEQRAHENLGDARWLLDLHEVEKEEDRIALAISRHEAPEDVLPDLDDLDLDAVLAAATDLPASGQEVTAETAEPRTLYASEVAFWKDACLELERAGVVERPEWHDDVQGVSWPLAADLERRFAHLPPELRREAGGVLKLTADRALVQRSLADARKHSGRFPEWQYLWPLHPVAGWLEDRLLASYARHEAPLLRHPGLPDDACVFVMEGVLSNQASQPVVIDWFGVLFVGNAAPEVWSFDQLEARASLRAALSNDGQKLDAARAEALRRDAVEAARAHLSALRMARRDQLMPELRAEQKRLAAWKQQRLAQIAARRQKAEAEGRKLRRDEELRLERLAADTERRVKDRDRWVNERLSTVDAPSLRIAAVLVGAGFVGKGKA